MYLGVASCEKNRESLSPFSVELHISSHTYTPVLSTENPEPECPVHRIMSYCLCSEEHFVMRYLLIA
ncbi:hypothetical protein NDU88_000221 [Pleurodeles waltl]|uniref:Uncharacterized protein n=1 Tax=Pleurodeles waltl TaxID=8319 RepID=A0AAV7VSV3_PLEWA|nr:hypothetical protein NDU88_000221 [Pleurodeles waltl]